MNYNLSSGYGQQQALNIDKLGSGKTFVVGDSSTANLNMLEQLFRPDPDGTLRFFSTIDAAINACTASAGDNILVMPGHTETLSTASAITADIAGVSIIGLGVGADRPTLTFSETAATFVISAASVKVKNIIVTCSKDAVVSPFVISAADCELEIESRDASTSIEFTNIVLTTADADNLKITLKHVGFTGGSGNTNAVRLVGGTNTRIYIDYFGLASTAVVEFHTTAVIDAYVSGYMYNHGTTDFSKSVVDTVSGSTWYSEFHDGGAGQYVNGGSGDALAAGDLSAMASAIAVIDAFHDVGTADATTNTVMSDVIGNKTDAAAATGTTKSIVANVKYACDSLDTIDAFHDVATADAATNAVMSDVVGNKADAAVGAPTTTKTLMAYLKGVLDDTTVIGTIVNAGGTATLGAALGDFANDTLVARLDDIGTDVDSTTTDNIQGKIGTDAEMADASLFDLLAGQGVNGMGTVIFVAVSGGDDANGGLNPKAPKATVAAAITAAGAGGTVVLGPGDHSIDVSAAAMTPLANQRFVAQQPSFGGYPTAWILADADDGTTTAEVDVSGVSFKDIGFAVHAGGTTHVILVDVAQTTAVNGLVFENCWFDFADIDISGVTAINVDDATNATTGLAIVNCRFTGGSATTNQAVYVDIGVGGVPKMLAERNVFELESADGDAKAFLFADPAASNKSYGITIRDNDFIGPPDGGNDAVPIEFNAGMTEDEIMGIIRSNYFSSCSATPITQDDVNTSIVRNYVGDDATGGTLVDPGT